MHIQPSRVGWTLSSLNQNQAVACSESSAPWVCDSQARLAPQSVDERYRTSSYVLEAIDLALRLQPAYMKMIVHRRSDVVDEDFAHWKAKWLVR